MAPCGAVLSRAVPPPRCFLLGEIEKEEKEKVWYYAQLQSLSKRLEELPHVETVSGGPMRGPGGVLSPPHLTWPCAHPPPPPLQFSMQMDLIRQQLQFEAQHIRALMEERFGTADEMVQRAQVGEGGAPHSSAPIGAISHLLPPPSPVQSSLPLILAPSWTHPCSVPTHPSPGALHSAFCSLALHVLAATLLHPPTDTPASCPPTA